MKRAAMTILLLVVGFGFVNSPGLARDSISIMVNNKPLSLPLQPTMVDGHVVVPLEPILQALGVTSSWDPHNRTLRIHTIRSRRMTKARVVDVVDGDSLRVTWLDGERLPSSEIRLIGVDAPEFESDGGGRGNEAYQFTKRQLGGATVWLTKDVSETDPYGRSLRFVWTSRPTPGPTEEQLRENMFNAKLIAHGYARAAAYPSDVKFQDVFRRFQREARNKDRGLWGASRFIEKHSSASVRSP